ncbi:MAG: type I-B CRISPR-associated protein Cas5b [Chloroflexota bacterium]
MSAPSSEPLRRALIFELWGDYGLFKRFYTTASPLSYAIPPPPSVAGILGAIAGSGKRSYLRDFGPDRCRVALRLTRPVKKTRLGLNWVNTSGETDLYFRSGVVTAHNPVKVELLKDPGYRLYVSLEDPDLQARLGDLLRSGQSVYTVSLGPANLLASFRFVGEETLARREAGSYHVGTVVPVDGVRWPPAGRGIGFETGQRFAREHLPRRMEADRRVTGYVDVIVETSGRSFDADLVDAYGVGDETIVFL